MKRLYLVLLSLVIGLTSINADSWVNYSHNSSEGQEFYVTFMFNNAQTGNAALHLQLFMAARRSAKVTITSVINNRVDTMTVDSFLVWELPMPSEAYSHESNKKTNNCLKIESDKPISLYFSSFDDERGDASLVLPVNALGNEYVVQSSNVNEQSPSFAIVATEAGITTVTINPTVNLLDNSVEGSILPPLPANTSYNISLSQGQVYYAAAENSQHDISGTTISASQKVAMFNGSQFAIVKHQLIQALDIRSNIFHQAEPVMMCGVKYPLVKFLGQDSCVVRVTAIYDSTYIYQNGVLIDSLQAFESTTINWAGGQNSMFVESSKQSYCYQYMFREMYENGSPAMVLMNDLEQDIQSTKFSTFTIVTGEHNVRDTNMANFVNIIVSTSGKNSMKIDNVPVTNFSPVDGLSGYWYAQVPVNHGAHELINPAGFLATVYGYDHRRAQIPSYAFNPGFNCIHQDAYFLINGDRVPEAYVKEGADSLWHLILTSVVNGDYDSIQWYDYYGGGGGAGGGGGGGSGGGGAGGGWGTYLGTGDVLNPVLENPQEHTIYMVVYRHSPLTGDTVIDGIFADLYCCQNTHDIIYLPACQTDTVVIFGDTISCDSLIIGKIYSFRKDTVCKYGCDSITTYNLQVINRQDSNITTTICAGDTCTFRKHDFTEAGTYYVLDSIGHCYYHDTLNLIVNPSYRFTETDTICFNEQPYKWRGFDLEVDSAATYIFHDSLKTDLGCDSLFELILTIGAVDLITDTVHECTNHLPYEWHGRQFTEPGIYYDSLLSRFGCDSVHCLMLTIDTAYRFTDTMTVCSNDAFVWRDSLYNGFEPGIVTIYDSLVTSLGCDSVYAMRLTVKPANIFYTDTTICDNEILVWRGHHIYGNQVENIPPFAETVDSGYHLISDSLINVLMCDSIYHLRLNVNKSYHQIFEDTICQGGSYVFDNTVLTWHNDIPGVHDSIVHYVSSMGCDSVLHLILTVNPVYTIEHYDTVCNNMSFNWRYADIDTTISEQTSGTYDYHFYRQTVSGCDSIHILHLTVLDTVLVSSVVYIPDEGSYFWDNEMYGGTKCTVTCDNVLPVSPTPYFFRHVYTAANGCDSIMTLTIKVDPTYDFSLPVATCQHDDYLFNGTPWSWKKDIVGNHDTTYRYKTVAGYDSLWTIHLRVDPVYLITDTQSTCQNVPFIWNGHRRSFTNLSPGIHTFYDSLKSSVGFCDSIHKLILVVHDTMEHTEYQTICDNETIMWDGQLICGAMTPMENGTSCPAREEPYQFEHRYSTVKTSCDSIERLILFVKKSYIFELDTSLCSTEGFTYRNIVYTKSGVYCDSLKTADGCDSIYILNLELGSQTTTKQYIGICEGDTFVYRGKVIKEPGIYFDTLTTSFVGCDSIIELHFDILPTYYIRDTVQICDGGSYNFHGRKITHAGTFRDSLTTVSGCDSIYELFVIVAPKFHSIEYDTVCSNSVYRWRDKYLTESGIYFDSLISKGGCDSVYELRLTMNRPSVHEEYIEICAGNTFYFRGKPVSEPGIYYDTLNSVHGCDSIYMLVLNFAKTYYFHDTVRICDGDAYSWHNRTITHAGTYRDSLTTINGCDSIYELFVKIAPKYHYIEYDTICSNNIYRWHDKDFTESGIYFDSLISKSGCDSIYELQLTVNKPSIHEQYIEICVGNSYYFRGKQVAKPGIYYDTLKSVHGCDSIFKLTLNVTPTYYFLDTVQICDGDAYSWHNRTITHAGTYRDSLTTFNSGCDSIYELFVKIAPKYHYIEYDTICSNNIYRWHDKDFTESGIYFDSLISKSGCDSIYELRLTMYHPDILEEYVEICTGGSFNFRGKQISSPGIYYDTLTNVHGCDSIYKLVLNFAKTYYFRDTTQICDGETYNFRGRAVTLEGTYRDTLKTVSGCDSIFEMFVRVAPKFHDIAYDTVCSNQSYHWRGKWLSESGTYFDSLKSTQGCDSVYEMRLTMYRPTIHEEYIEICEGASFDLRGRQISQPGVYYDTLTNVHGCDSIYKLVLNYAKTYYFRDTAQICDGESFNFRGKTITHAGTYRDSLKTISGCDSIYELFLKVAPKFHNIEYDTVCSNKTYHWRGKWLTEGGTYFDSLKNSQGCDSIYELRLTMSRSTIHEMYVEVCQGDSFDFRGRNVTVPGIYYDTLTSIHKCDSIIQLVFNVTRKYHFYETAQICDGDTDYWHGQNIYKAGTYYDYQKTVGSGCDSIYELFVTMVPKYHFIEYDTVCSDNVYLWRNKSLTESGTYFDSLRSTQGCDSVYEMRLTMFRPTFHEMYVEVCQGDSFDFRGTKVTAPGVYYDTIINSHGCDSIIKLVFNVTRSYRFYETLQICDGDTHYWHGKNIHKAGTYRDSLKTVNSGCDSIYELFVTMVPTYHFIEYDTVCSDNVYLWRDKSLTESGTYFDSLRSTQGCDSVYEMRLTMFRPTFHEMYVEVCQGDSFDFRGKRVTQPGVYYDTIINSHGCDSIIKLVFNVTRSYRFYETLQICDGDTHYWHGKNIYKAGTYRDSLKTVNSGCDSIYELFVTTVPTYHFIEYDTVCSDNIYLWRNKSLTEGGTYFDSLRSTQGCDSVYELRLAMFNPTITEQYVEVCQGGSFYFRGEQVTEPGVYYDTLISTHGCDSIIKYTFNVTRTYYFRDTVLICDGDTYNFHGRPVTYAGTYRDTLKTFNSGCDSIYELFVQVAPKFHHIEYDTVISNTTYHWRGKWITESGTYFDSLKSHYGCDSVYELRLTMYVPPVFEKYVEVCEGTSYNFRGQIITESGIYYDTLIMSHGFDSVYMLVINFVNTYYFRDTTYICDGQTYNFRGRTITHAGTYRDSLKTVACGCDSIYELYVLSGQPFHDVKTVEICSDTTYFWRGKSLTESGTYYDTLQSHFGCDSVYELQLTMHRTTRTELYIEVCAGGSFDFRGKMVTEPGTYYDTLTNVHGCDSIVKLVFNFSPTYYMRDTVTICDGDFYNFRGRNIIRSGTYRDTLKTSVSGCDSIYEIFVDMKPQFHSVAYDTVCSDTVYHWRGKHLTESGTYFDTLKSHFGCDSVYELRLTMFRNTSTELYIEVCAGGSFNFRGRLVTEPGTYYDTLTNVHGCDSICKLVFNFSPSYYMHDTVTICEGDVYDFRGRNIVHAGTYRDTMKTAISGCDSIYELFVIVEPHFRRIEYDTVCSDTVYYWRSKNLTESGIYYDTLKSHYGCDSVYELRLTMYHTSMHEEYIEVCQGGSFNFRGRLITEPGTYYDTLTNVHGCDSICKLVFNYAKSYYFRDTVMICDGDVYNFRGKPLTFAGTYRDTLKTVSGCDSIFEAFVIVKPKFHKIEYDTVCSDSVYYWRGKNITESGTYFDSLKGHFGCDSVYELRLIMGTPTLTEHYIEVCEGESFSFRGDMITEPGIYYDTLINGTGCDSVIKIVFNVTRTYHYYENMTVCDGDTNIWHTQKIYKAGTYFDSLTTRNSGCDSIYELHVTLADTYHILEYDTVCSNNVYLWRGKHITKSGTYFDSLRSSMGCDSVYELRLIMDSATMTERYIEICQGRSFAFRGHMITESCVYYDTIVNHRGCDSITKYVFNVTSSYHFYDTYQICDGSSYTWRGKIITLPGTYFDSLTTATSGCDSIYELYVTHAIKYYYVIYDTICTNETYNWQGQWLSASGTYIDSLRSSAGCDSILELRLTVYPNMLVTRYHQMCPGSSFVWNGHTITRPGTYYDTLQRSTLGCDSVIKLIVSYAPVYELVDTAYICEGSSYTFHSNVLTVPGTYRDTMASSSGCDSIHKLVLKTRPRYQFVTDTAICSNDVLMFAGKRITASGTYYDRHTSIYGCDSTYILNATVYQTVHDTMAVPICIHDGYTTPTGKHFTESGIYYDTLITSHGCDHITTYIVNAYTILPTYDTLAICRGDSITGRDGIVYKAEGDYTSVIRGSGDNCDAAIYTHVFYDNVSVSMYANICQGNSYTFRGNVYTQTGTYPHLVPAQSAGECDTMYTLNLTVSPLSRTAIFDTTCDNSPYWFNGTQLTQTGSYSDTLTSASGCDSIVTLHLIIYDRIVDTVYRTICYQDSFEWFGTWYRYDGSYNYVDVDSKTRCNIYRTLVLTTLKQTQLISVLDVDMCQDEDDYVITPSYSGSAPSRFTLRYDGVDIPASNDIIDGWFDGKSVTVPIPLDKNGNRIRPDNYTVSLQIGSGDCGMSVQTSSFNLLVRYPSSILEQHFNDVVSVLNHNYNGGYSFSDYRWYVNGRKVGNANGSNLYNLSLAPNDVVYAELQRKDDNYFIPTCPITIVDLGPDDIDYPVTVVAGHLIAQVTAKEAATYRLCTVSGLILKSGDIGKDEEMDLSLPYIAGCYFFVVNTENAGQKIFKLVVH